MINHIAINSPNTLPKCKWRIVHLQSALINCTIQTQNACQCITTDSTQSSRSITIPHLGQAPWTNKGGRGAQNFAEKNTLGKYNPNEENTQLQ